MPRPRTHQRGSGQALAAYLARRRRQTDRAWESTPVSFLARLGFDVSRISSRRFALPAANWRPGELWETPSLPESELSFAAAREDQILGESFQTGAVEAAAEARTNEAIEAPPVSAPDRTPPSSRVAEAEGEPAVETSLPKSAEESDEPLTDALPQPPIVEPIGNRRRARVEEVSSTKSRESEAARQTPAATAKPGEAPDAVNEIDPARLFEPTTERDLSPAAWAKRLALVIAEEQQSKPARERTVKSEPAASATAVQEKAGRSNVKPVGREAPFIPPARRESAAGAETLSAPTRRFLRPLIGFDPADVPVVRGVRAEQITGELHADAATIGQTVVIGSAFANESPEQLGVLAHELTHVARRRQPRFVPPIARDVRQGSAGFAPSPETPETMDEEALARRVEGRVIRAAEQFLPALSAPPIATETETATGREPGKQQQWEKIGGALPAPWESLPGWASSPASDPNPMAAPPGAISRSIDDDRNRRLHLVVGVVTDNKDPARLGRVKVKYPWLSAEQTSDWARVVSPGAGRQRGLQFTPRVEDEVLVGFEMGDVHHPYVIGGLWNGQAKPHDPDDVDKIIIADPNNNRIELGKDGVTIKGSVINLN
ncbi:MAG: phage baseplate assembly protein V [Blastocatellia bacterium]